jgi:hypothetical protein
LPDLDQKKLPKLQASWKSPYKVTTWITYICSLQDPTTSQGKDDGGTFN